MWQLFLLSSLNKYFWTFYVDKKESCSLECRQVSFYDAKMNLLILHSCTCRCPYLANGFITKYTRNTKTSSRPKLESVWRLWQPVRATCSTSSDAIGIATPSRHRRAHLPRHHKTRSSSSTLNSNAAGLGSFDAAIHLLWQSQGVDHLPLLGLHSPNIPRHFFTTRDRNAFENILELVPKSRLHCLCIQHSPCHQKSLPEALHLLLFKCYSQLLCRPYRDWVFERSFTTSILQMEDGWSCSPSNGHGVYETQPHPLGFCEYFHHHFLL